MRKTGLLLLREKNFTLEKAKALVWLQKTDKRMLQGRSTNMKISVVDTKKVCQLCDNERYSVKECRTRWRNHGQSMNKTVIPVEK